MLLGGLGWGLFFMPLFSKQSEWSMPTWGGGQDASPCSAHSEAWASESQNLRISASRLLCDLGADKRAIILQRLRAPKASSFWGDGPVAESHTEVK